MTKTKCLVLPILFSAIAIGCQNINPTYKTNDQAISMHTRSDNFKNKQISPITAIQLSNYTWQLTKILDSNNRLVKVLDDNSVLATLEFESSSDQPMARFSVGCNAMGGVYSLTDNILFIKEIKSTKMFCKELDKVERLLAEAMRGKSRLNFTLASSKQTKPTLAQTIPNGYTLIWQGEQLKKIDYQQNAEIVFWEVDNVKQDCPNGTGEHCLKVRPIYYDENGIKTVVGDWSIFVGKINGYHHDSSHEQIIRLKRFTIDPSDVKGKQFKYVFDGVVESSLVK